jgi:hypothetical protein
VQPDLASRLLNDLKIQNEQIFREMPVDMSIFGKFDISGNNDDEGEPCPRVWDPLRQCWSDDWKEFLYDVELKHENEQFESLRYRLSDKCADPKTLMDIIDAGVKDPHLATNAIGEVLHQLYNQDRIQVLFTYDGYNTWMQKSEYESFRYVNDPLLKGHIPPRDLSLVRMLLKFDGHMVRQGVKYCSTTHQHSFNHIMTPEMIDWFPGYSHRVPNMTLDEFRNFVTWKQLTQQTWFKYHEWQVEKLFMECQGNYRAYNQNTTHILYT